MNNKLTEMVLSKNPRNDVELENKIKEVVQETILASLAKTNFFSNAAFYGGTCLRIFYGLPRFSEDLDFCLIAKDEKFSWDRYFQEIKKIFDIYGLKITLEQREKIVASDTRSAFLKENTIETLTVLFPDMKIKNINHNSLIKVKFEVDIEPPYGANYSWLNVSEPFFGDVKTLDIPSLFAGKISAILSRPWKNRVKGRDLYDYLFYIGKGASINLKYLENNLIKAKLIEQFTILDLDLLKQLLTDKFNVIDYEEAKNDVKDFIEEQNSLLNWSKQYFIDSLERLKIAYK
jgi:predicted nucleotidyltransferase component of viral defense system